MLRRSVPGIIDKQMSIRLFKSLPLRKKRARKKLAVVGSFHFVSMAAIFIGQKLMPTSLTFQFSSQSAVDMGDEMLSNEVSKQTAGIILSEEMGKTCACSK